MNVILSKYKIISKIASNLLYQNGLGETNKNNIKRQAFTHQGTKRKQNEHFRLTRGWLRVIIEISAVRCGKKHNYKYLRGEIWE
jgi:hypothetical protein